MTKINVDIPAYIKDWHDYIDEKPQNHCKEIKQLKKLVLKLLKNKDVWYDPIDVEAFIDFCKLLKHREGRWAGQPLELNIEQKYIAACVLGFKMHDKELNLDVRYFREMVIFIARKWGKSTFISALADFLLICDGENSGQVWCLATQKSQASIVYESAKSFLKTSDVITPPHNPTKHWRTKRDRDNSEMILYPKTNSVMKVGGKNSNSQDGLNPSAVIIDELHAIKDRNTYDVFSSAAGARTQFLSIIISTFGFVREGIFDSIYERCKKVLNGKSKERLFPMIFKIDDEDDPADRTCWIKANPSLGSHPTMSYLEGEYKKALEDPAQMPSFLAKHLNRASNSSYSFFDLAAINKCAVDIKEEDFKALFAVGGVDIAETTDLCCASALIPVNGKFKLIQKYFIASARIEKNAKQDKMAYESFTNTNAEIEVCRELLKICDGAMVKKSDITQWYIELSDKYEVIFWKIGYDRWHGSDWIDDMESNGFSKEDKEGYGVTFPVAQGAKSLSAPMKQTKVLFEDGLIEYDRHNGLFRWCCSNVSARLNPNNEIQPDKSKSRSRIDGYVSFLIAYVAYEKVKAEFEAYQN